MAKLHSIKIWAPSPRPDTLPILREIMQSPGPSPRNVTSLVTLQDNKAAGQVPASKVSPDGALAKHWPSCTHRHGQGQLSRVQGVQRAGAGLLKTGGGHSQAPLQL